MSIRLTKDKAKEEIDFLALSIFNEVKIIEGMFNLVKHLSQDKEKIEEIKLLIEKLKDEALALMDKEEDGD